MALLAWVPQKPQAGTLAATPGLPTGSGCLYLFWKLLVQALFPIQMGDLQAQKDHGSEGHSRAGTPGARVCQQ